MSIPTNQIAAEGRSVALLQALVASLAHQIRTPLSVIANDVAYWAEVLPEAETKRVSQQIETISKILSSLQSKCDYSEEAAIVALDQLIECNDPELSRVHLNARPRKMREAFLIVEKCAANIQTVEVIRWFGELSDETLTLQCSESPFLAQTETTLTSLALRYLGEKYVPEAVFADSVLSDANVILRASSEGKQFTLTIPVARPHGK